MPVVNMPAFRGELVATLEEALRLQERLVADAGAWCCARRGSGGAGDSAGAGE